MTITSSHLNPIAIPGTAFLCNRLSAICSFNGVHDRVGYVNGVERGTSKIPLGSVTNCQRSLEVSGRIETD